MSSKGHWIALSHAYEICTCATIWGPPPQGQNERAAVVMFQEVVTGCQWEEVCQGSRLHACMSWVSRALGMALTAMTMLKGWQLDCAQRVAVRLVVHHQVAFQTWQQHRAVACSKSCSYHGMV